MNIELLRLAIDYDPQTGRMTWKERNPEQWPDARTAKIFNLQFAGKPVGVVAKNGYVLVSFLGKRFYAHRVAWAITHGEQPESCIDHANGIRTDNRLANLRVATESQNRHNTGIRSVNTSGHKNVSWSKSLKRWSVEIRSNGKRHFIGYFLSKSEAAMAAKNARKKLHGEFARHA